MRTSLLPRGGTPATPVRASPPPNVLGRHPAALFPLASSTPPATGAARALRRLSPRRQAPSPVHAALRRGKQGRQVFTTAETPIVASLASTRVPVRPVLSPMAWSATPSSRGLGRTGVHSAYGHTFIPGTRSWCASSRETASSGSSTPKRLNDLVPSVPQPSTV